MKANIDSIMTQSYFRRNLNGVRGYHMYTCIEDRHQAAEQRRGLISSGLQIFSLNDVKRPS